MIAERKTAFTLLLLLSILLSAALPFETRKAQDPIDGNDLSEGDLAVSGRKVNGTQCQFEEFAVSTTPLGDGSITWLGLRLDENCNLIVGAKWIGLLEDGPAEVVDPLFALLPNATEPAREAPISESNFTSLVSYRQQTCKTSNQYIYMYGLAGSGDKLTHKWGSLTFCYNGTTATISSHTGSCNGSQPFSWTWVLDGCVTTFVVPGPAATVYRAGRGDYHCSPISQFPCNASNPDGYFHNLQDTEYGNSNGSSTCVYSYGGVIVLGVGRDILQGCS